MNCQCFPIKIWISGFSWRSGNTGLLFLRNNWLELSSSGPREWACFLQLLPLPPLPFTAPRLTCLGVLPVLSPPPTPVCCSIRQSALGEPGELAVPNLNNYSISSSVGGNWGFPDSSAGKESICKAGDLGLIPGLGRSCGGGHGNPLQYSCLENPHGQRSLADYGPWSRKELDTTEWLRTAQHEETDV